MQAIPDILNEYLEKNVKDRLTPAYLCSNQCGGLLGWGGELNFYHLDSVSETDKISDVLPAIIGSEDISEPLVLPMVAIQDKVADIHIVPRKAGGVYVLLIDVTEGHHQQQVIQQKANEVQLLNSRLEKTLKELKKTQLELEKKKEEAEAASIAKSQFIAGMSHEFRTPLTSIMGYTEILERQFSGEKDRLGSIRRGAEHLLSMVDNLLDHARFESQEIAIHPVSTHIGQLIMGVQQLFTPLALEKRLALSCDISDDVIDLEALVDDMRLRQVLVNLVGNAIKYTEAGTVSINVYREGETLRVDVVDTGVGIPITQQEVIFDAFHRMEQHQNHTGAGIGLSITRHIMEMMGGWLTLESDDGEGSTFSLNLPISDVVKHKEPEQSVVASGRKVLLAEDNDDIADMVSFFLDEMNCEVFRASNGKEAIEYSKSNHPDLVLMDINMPEIDGYEATKHLRQEEGFSSPILALTASPSSADREKAHQAGFDNYLTKPISFDSLMAAVQTYLG